MGWYVEFAVFLNTSFQISGCQNNKQYFISLLFLDESSPSFRYRVVFCNSRISYDIWKKDAVLPNCSQQNTLLTIYINLINMAII